MKSGGPTGVRARWWRSVVAVGSAVGVLAALVLPAGLPANPATAEEAAPANGGGPSVLLTLDPADVTCHSDGVSVDARLIPEPPNVSSWVGLRGIPDGFTVRSSWQVFVEEPLGPVPTSLGFVDTPMVNPAGLSEDVLPPGPYVDDVRFGNVVDTGGEFTYVVILQLLDTDDNWVQGVQGAITCGGATPQVVVDDVPSEVVPEPAAAGDALSPEAVSWGPCADPDALPTEQCGTLLVPLDHFDGGVGGPQGTSIELALNRIPAASGDSRGALLTNPGGPGAAGLGLSRSLASVFAGTAVTEHYDIIGMDPRGVGESSPAPFCVLSSPLDAGPANVLDPDWTAFFDAGVPVASAFGSVCSVAAARTLAYLGTRQVAADMDWIRRAEDLGRGSNQPLSFFGGSYGTRLGEVYLQQYGDHAGRFVLSGSVDPASDFTDWYAGRAVPPDDVFVDLFLPAAAEGTAAQFAAVVEALSPSASGAGGAGGGVEVTVGTQAVEVTLGQFLGTILGSLRAETTWPSTQTFIADTYDAVVVGEPDAVITTPIEPESPDPLPLAPQLFDERSPELLVGPLSPAPAAVAQDAPPDLDRQRGLLNSSTVLNVVNCIDLPGVLATSAEMAAAAEAVAPGDPPNLLGWPFLGALGSCVGLAVDGGDADPDKVWPARPFPDGTPAPLVIGSVGDTATLYPWSVAMQEFLQAEAGGAGLLTYEGAEHVAGVSWPPPPCVSAAIVALYATDTLPGPDDDTCAFISPFARIPPTNVTATAGDGEVRLSWVPASQRLGGNVNGYAVDQRVAGDTGEWTEVDTGSCTDVKAAAEATGCVVGGLTNGVAYEFRIVTLPAFAFAPLEASTPTAAVTPTAPVPPGPPGPPVPTPAPDGGPSPDAAGGLPTTGAAVLPLVVLAAGLLLGGLGLTALRRRTTH